MNRDIYLQTMSSLGMVGDEVSSILAGEKLPVLDHGFVRLVEWMGSDLSIVRNARVSFDADWRSGNNEGSDKKLINYLMKNRHTSPFEAVVFTFEVKAPIFIFRQWHRHRTWAYNEISARYTQLDEGFYVPEARHIGVQSKDNKQARDMVQDEKAIKAASMHQDAIRTQCMLSFQVYENMLQDGVPRELARGVLPVNAYSRMFATVNLHNLFKFLELRLHSHAQWEFQQYGKVLLRIIDEICPVAVAAFEEHILKR